MSSRRACMSSWAEPSRALRSGDLRSQKLPEGMEKPKLRPIALSRAMVKLASCCLLDTLVMRVRLHLGSRREGILTLGHGPTEKWTTEIGQRVRHSTLSHHSRRLPERSVPMLQVMELIVHWPHIIEDIINDVPASYNMKELVIDVPVPHVMNEGDPCRDHGHSSTKLF